MKNSKLNTKKENKKYTLKQQREAGRKRRLFIKYLSFSTGLSNRVNDLAL